MTESNPDNVYRAALTLARHDYAALKVKQDALQLEIEATEKRIGIFRSLIAALAAILGVDDELPETEATTRRFRMKRG